MRDGGGEEGFEAGDELGIGALVEDAE